MKLMPMQKQWGTEMSVSNKIDTGNVCKIADSLNLKNDELNEKIVKTLHNDAELIANQVISRGQPKINWDFKLDNILTSRWLGFPIMGVILCLALWLTISGANYPSQVLADVLFWGQDKLSELFTWAHAPEWAHGFFILGVYRCVAWVISVMLPPMAIFFPLFTILEDFGYLPRVAFNLDNFFRKAGCHGKQALTMCMGFGCNAAGIISCRIIDSPRERLIAVLTNNFVPCNGRFPTLIAMATIFLGGAALSLKSIIASGVVAGIIIIGIITTLLVSYVLSKTMLKGIPSSFSLELPPYRKPLIGQVIIRSIFDRTIFVLGRAIMIAAPAGAIIWILANVSIQEVCIFAHCTEFLDPFARLLGLDGIILMAFILGLPANEIVLPIMIMGYLNTGTMLELNSLQELRSLLVGHGWTWLTALEVMLFSLLHYPCGTTLVTIYKETKSIKWTLVSVLMPLCVACFTCLVINQLITRLGLI